MKEQKNLIQIVDKNGNNLSLRGENWRQVEFEPNTYVSDKGRVYSVKHKKIRKLDLVKNKYSTYHRISLRINGKDIHFQLGRLVAMVWCEGYDPEKAEELEVHHKDLNSLNDAASNLVWLDTKTHDLLHRMLNAYKRTIANRLAQLKEVVDYDSKN